MLMPSIFGENLFDDWFDEFPFYDMDKEMNNTEKKLYGKKAGRIMKTDIKEQKDGYELMIDLPGFTKDEIKASVSDGYLTISAAKGLDKDEKEKDRVTTSARNVMPVPAREAFMSVRTSSRRMSKQNLSMVS